MRCIWYCYIVQVNFHRFLLSHDLKHQVLLKIYWLPPQRWIALRFQPCLCLFSSNSNSVCLTYHFYKFSIIFWLWFCIVGSKASLSFLLTIPHLKSIALVSFLVLINRWFSWFITVVNNSLSAAKFMPGGCTCTGLWDPIYNHATYFKLCDHRLGPNSADQC